MRFLSTRGKDSAKNAAEAIVKGLAEDGGLFVPETFPDIYSDISNLLKMDYPELAAKIIGSYLSEYNQKELLCACKNSYKRFEDENPAPVVRIDKNNYILELFHGPTLAFKDIALTLLPYLLRKGADICGIKEKILILVATSGDTGKAALSGFMNQQGIKINVFYPSDGVSDMQKLQMCCQKGENVNVTGIKGNFDDCQNAVKEIFSSKNYEAKIKEKNYIFSSANSINFGRLVPQIVYYFSSYIDLVNSNEIKLNDKINFVVPTGNFGDILAGYYAKKMGLPINKLICASNSNNVLTEFFASGSYDKNREFFKTISPSMDILISSNLERFLFEISDRNTELTKQRMDELKINGSYSINKEELNKINSEIYAGFTDEQECNETIFNVFENYGYVLDPHTAVAFNVKDYYKKYTNDMLPIVTLSTANFYKFPQSVLFALTGKTQKDAFKASKLLENLTACPIPESISELKSKEKRFNKVIDKKLIFDEILNFIN